VYRRLVWQRPRLAGVLLPAALVHVFWWSYVLPRHLLVLFGSQDGATVPGYWMSVTMVFGSLVAGATSVGGAAVAFPVMTLAFGIAPAVARDFALMIQTVGMLSAAFTIVYQRIVVDWTCIVWCTVGGAVSTPAGLAALHFIGPLPPAISKTIFLSSWMAFAAALFLLNMQAGRATHLTTPVSPGAGWKRGAYLVAGLLGGLLTTVSGSGMDLAGFAVQTLLFRVSEKTATPTSVVLMALNTAIGFFAKGFWLGGMSTEATHYWLVSVPVVTFGAPIGSWAASYFHRLCLAGLVITADLVQFCIGMAILLGRAHEGRDTLIAVTLAIVMGGGATFGLLSWSGARLLRQEQALLLQ
jgi:uncharacterized membrane protein YfcA